MGQLIAQIKDPLSRETAQLMIDKRQKYYINSVFGIYKLQTKKGQEFARKLAEKVSEKPAPQQGLSNNSEKPETLPEQKHKTPAKKGLGGFLSDIFKD